MSSKKLYFVAGLIILIMAGVFWWTKRNIPDVVIDQGVEEAGRLDWRCLNKDENSDYPLKDGTRIELNIPKYPLNIFVRDITNTKIINSFEIADVRDNYHPVELRNCGAYVTKQFNHNPKTAQQSPGYRVELWKYDYNGKGIKLLMFSEIKETGEYNNLYNQDFRVDPQERYVVLQRGYMGKDDYALVIKDLATKQDVFELGMQELYEQDDKLMGDFGMLEWTQDGRYFWGRIAGAARTLGVYRIDTKNWTYELYQVPENLMGGEQLNVENGWITYHTDLVWTGIYEAQEEIKAERRAQGLGTKFYLYNLLTGKRVLVYETQEPLFFTEPKWISESEVEYKVPEGETRIYELNQ